MEPSVTAALAIAALASVGFGLNETTHGGVAEAMGLGHHHLFGDDAWHCGEAAHARGAHGHAHPEAAACAAHEPPRAFSHLSPSLGPAGAIP